LTYYNFKTKLFLCVLQQLSQAINKPHKAMIQSFNSWNSFYN